MNVVTIIGICVLAFSFFVSFRALLKRKPLFETDYIYCGIGALIGVTMVLYGTQQNTYTERYAQAAANTETIEFKGIPYRVIKIDTEKDIFQQINPEIYNTDLYYLSDSGIICIYSSYYNRLEPYIINNHYTYVQDNQIILKGE